MFTWNCPDTMEDIDNWRAHPEELLQGRYQYLIYQWEIGTNLHIQGYVYFKERIKFSTLKNFNDQIHWEKRKGTHTQAKHYCSKPHTKGKCQLNCHPDKTCECKICDDERKAPTVIEGTTEEYGDDSTIPDSQGDRTDLKKCKEIIETKKDWARTIQDEHFGDWIRYNKEFKKYDEIVKERNVKDKWKKDNLNLRNWQRQCVQKLDIQNDRQILWYVDFEGGRGKTWLAKWLVANRDAFYMINGKSADVAHAYNGESYVVFDFTRDYKEYINYSIIEQMKNGLVFKSKYESKMMFTEPAKVVVFSNWEPEGDKLSSDRLNVILLTDQMLLDDFIME